MTKKLSMPMMTIRVAPDLCIGRPPSEVRQALLDAVIDLSTPERCPTLNELCRASKVGVIAARQTVSNMLRAKVLVIVRRRRVSYRNRPVAEYGVPVVELVPAAAVCQVRGAVAAWLTPTA